MKHAYLVLSLIIGLNSFGQQRIDSSLNFQSDPNKKFSIYIPSTYSQGTPHRLMLALHPFNTNRWDAKSWCDTLIAFADSNQLILLSPDGGVDGKVDDAIDTAFTSALLDSMELWYSIDTGKVFAMGFSWGGLTVYSYGLNHSKRIKGFMPIGAAINGTSSISSVLSNANGKPFYVVHGDQDSPSSRYTPLVNGLNNNGAILESLLMGGVGHTIDFPNRNAILSVAYEWIDSVNSIIPDTTDTNTSFIGTQNSNLKLLGFKKQESSISLVLVADVSESVVANLYNLSGQLLDSVKTEITKGVNTIEMKTGTASGMFLLHIEGKEIRLSEKLVQ